ncbi:alpha/beta hydrolase [Lentibacillus kapialis]|uniref:Alpha/beta hydrolase n=1 Tax=Lentibacillus kapialis TaxID=340214 RepID=A0A917PZM6_9BACI|nr:alpha/beta hydrolase [Lentibacillus kapialis]GGK03531.1 alpha/beta hydrolase [Lentibacillus kapialis]
MEKTIWLTRPDNVDIHLKKWTLSEQEPKAIVQIAHGMIEHIGRYDHFANFLMENNIAIYGNDHRGHGKTAENQGLFGYFAEENGFEKVTDDMFAVTKQIKQDYPDKPVFLFGHSMGSFLARHYIQKYSDFIDGVMLSGTGHHSRITVETAMKIAAALPAKEKSKLMNTLVFSPYNKRIHNKVTHFDWLTGDEKIIQSYMDDPYCGFIPTAGFFKDLMTGLLIIRNPNNNRRIRADLPMLIISGTEDPVGNYTKGVWKVAELYNEAGLDHVITMLAEEGRHELLNEQNRHEIFCFLLDWIIGLTSKNS